MHPQRRSVADKQEGLSGISGRPIFALVLGRSANIRARLHRNYTNDVIHWGHQKTAYSPPSIEILTPFTILTTSAISPPTAKKSPGAALISCPCTVSDSMLRLDFARYAEQEKIISQVYRTGRDQHRQAFHEKITDDDHVATRPREPTVASAECTATRGMAHA